MPLYVECILNSYSYKFINSSIFPATSVFKSCPHSCQNTFAIICKCLMYIVSISNDFNKYVDSS